MSDDLILDPIPGYSTKDSMEEAWAKYDKAYPEVLATWGRSSRSRWPSGHPNWVDPLDGDR